MEPNPAYIQWFNKHQMLFSWLISSISEEVYPHLIGLNSSSAVWKALETAYGVVNNAQRTQMYIELHNLKKDDKPVTEYLFQAKQLAYLYIS